MKFFFSFFIIIIHIITTSFQTNVNFHNDFLDLTNSIISYSSIYQPSTLKQIKKIVNFLKYEIYKRSLINLQVHDVEHDKLFNFDLNSHGLVMINVNVNGKGKSLFCNGNELSEKESYEIYIKNVNESLIVICIIGFDELGLLFGVGKFLRVINMFYIENYHERVTKVIEIERNYPHIKSSPKYEIRGHKISYGSISNCYDGWSVEMMENYIKDLIVFGTNQIELSAGNDNSPHFLISQKEMILEVSRICNEYGIRFSLYVSQSIDIGECEELVKSVERLDSFIVPSGDPGDLHVRDFIDFVEKRAKLVHQYQPNCKIWVTNQEFNSTEMDIFINILNYDQPKWLYGVAYGPHTRESLKSIRERIIDDYHIRHYPDIGHGLKCEYPNPEWSYAFAFSEARESINPRPKQMENIIQRTQQFTIGFNSYSEGCNDDLNKMIWSLLHWDPSLDLKVILFEYAKYFVGFKVAESFVDLVMLLEDNWVGNIPTPDSKTIKTLEEWQNFEKVLDSNQKLNWRIQTYLYRAYYDAYTEERLIFERKMESYSMGYLKEAIHEDITIEKAVELSLESLNRRYSNFEWELKINVLAEALYQSIRMQLSVSKYDSIGIGRGANLDTLNVPLNNKLFLEEEFDRIKKLKSHPEKIQALKTIVDWEDPGENGFYDSLGDMRFQSHVVKGIGWQEDPSYYDSYLMGYYEPFENVPHYRTSWLKYGQTLYDKELSLYYPSLSKSETYILKVVYPSGDVPIRLSANNGNFEIHPFIKKPNPPQIMEFEIPFNETKNGNLKLEFNVPHGRGGNGRGNQVSEVWLIVKKD